jgi:lipopolysaccharide/colanic/teichoic acid biosynthesis glycosyltransferase
MYRGFFKGLIERTLAALALVVLAPLLVLLALAIKLDSAGPVFFRQVRCGKGGVPFRIFKFRSMTVNAAGGPEITVKADARVTRTGQWLRKAKLDELPQLINVLSGDMALVGPRPEVPYFMDQYPPEQRETILSVRPGITDYGSILFRDENEILDGTQDPEQVYVREIMPIKHYYYARYVQDMSLITDMRIIIGTVLAIAGFNPGLGLEPAQEAMRRGQRG